MIVESQITGCILGTAVGDALGLPYEGLSRKRSPKLLGAPDRHRFLFRRGMISDDTEHTCLVAESLIASNFEPDAFTSDFSMRLRWWLASFPAGIGRATFYSCLKLWAGVSPTSSGVFSAGNGPAMRSAIFGAAFDDVDPMIRFVRISARMTHSDPKAEYGAIAIALATFISRQDVPVDGDQYVGQLATIIGADNEELVTLLHNALRSVAAHESTQEFAIQNGHERGVTGYTYHTVPVAIHAWLSNPRDYRAAVTSVIECGGDADTTAAIVGGIVGAATGEAGIPNEWVTGICEWPRTVSWMRRLARQLYKSTTVSVGQSPVSANFMAVLLRNMFFLVVVLIHGFRRMLPPY